MACPHLTEAFGTLAPPRLSQQVHKDECTLCFDDQDGPNGIDVCLHCFNGSCLANDREHSKLHYSKTGHALVLNVKRTPKPQTTTDQAQAQAPLNKLAIRAESDADKYHYTTTPKCLACDPVRELPRTELLEQIITAVMSAMSSAQQSQVKAWEEEILPCQHTRELQQHGQARKLQLSALASCSSCDLTSNLWLCLTCGNLGCGRAQFGGVGGNSHGLAHFEQTRHPVSVKQGTITAEGTADIYCYACNDARIDPHLANHLSHFGINVLDLSKTEKSMTELQLEQNLKFDFSMTDDDGQQLEPVYGPGLTGIRNLGNSCYMASVLQSLFALPSFQTRYLDTYRPHTLSCTNPLPATCFECQMGKIADGLLSGRYSVPRQPEQAQHEHQQQEQEQTPVFQLGIRPSMFKALVGKGHDEFATMRQQDADEFFKHLVTFIQAQSKGQSSSTSALTDPTRVFAFGLEQRLECTRCHRVRYTVEAQDAGLSLPVPIRAKPVASEGEGEGEGESSKVEYEPVSLTECLDIFTAPEELEYHCPACDAKVVASKRTRFTSFPSVLAVQVRRFQLINWVPQKVDVPILVPLEPFELDKYLGTGKQPGEEELPDDINPNSGSGSGSGSGGEVQVDAAALSQLTAMGFPEVRCHKALLATGNADAEAAMNWLFAHMEDPDIDDPIPPSSGADSVDTSMLQEMGFSRPQALKALRVNGGNPDAAVSWLFENPDDPGDDEQAGTAAAAAVAASTETVGGSASLPARYVAKAFISHKGPSVHSGHYVAHVRHGHGWTFFNDEKVVRASESSVAHLSTLAYEYMFERI